ncbi:MAG: sulfatase family protein [Planctomycetota bacterium]
MIRHTLPHRLTMPIALGLLVMFIAVAPVRAADKPNVIVIFTDDQGYGDLGCYGSPNIATPHIDRMAAEGVRFTAFYAAPFCGPSRAQLMTGSYPPRLSLAFNHGPGASTGIHRNEITIADMLKTQGYKSIHIGKWHLGDAEPFLSHNNGFDEFFGIPYSNDMWRYHPKMPPQPNEDELMRYTRERAAYTGFSGQGSYYPPGGGFPNDLPLHEGSTVTELNPDQTQLTTRYTERAIRFIDENKDGPFFIYLAHAMPHVPLFVSDKFKGKSPRGLYGDVISEIDWSVGQIIDALKQRELDDNTLIVYTSDNGPWLGYGIDGGSAGLLREGKGSTWEGGMRVPGIFRWPGKIPGGQVTTAVGFNGDILPTVAEISGAQLPTDRVLDGRSLMPLLTGQTDQSPHEYFYYFAGSRGPQINLRAVRDEKWKLILRRNPQGGELEAAELYDLGFDPSEKFDRLSQHRAEAERLLTAARKFYANVKDNQRPLGRLADDSPR